MERWIGEREKEVSVKRQKKTVIHMSDNISNCFYISNRKKGVCGSPLTCVGIKGERGEWFSPPSWRCELKFVAAAG